jgi:hypothetical protein
MPFQVNDSAGQGNDNGEFVNCGFLHPISFVFRESAGEEWETGFMVFVVKLGFMPSLELSLHWEF